MTHPPAAINTENVPTAMRTGVGHTGLRLLGAAVDVAPEDLLGVLPSLKVPALPSLSLLESSDPLISAELGCDLSVALILRGMDELSFHVVRLSVIVGWSR